MPSCTNLRDASLGVTFPSVGVGAAGASIAGAAAGGTAGAIGSRDTSSSAVGCTPAPTSGCSVTPPVTSSPPATGAVTPPAGIGPRSSATVGLGSTAGSTGFAGSMASTVSFAFLARGFLGGRRSSSPCSINTGLLKKLLTPSINLGLRFGSLAKSVSTSWTSARWVGSAKSLSRIASRSFLLVLPIPIALKSASVTGRVSTASSIVGAGCMYCGPRRNSGRSPGISISGVGCDSNSARCSRSFICKNARSASVTI